MYKFHHTNSALRGSVRHDTPRGGSPALRTRPLARLRSSRSGRRIRLRRKHKRLNYLLLLLYSSAREIPRRRAPAHKPYVQTYADKMAGARPGARPRRREAKSMRMFGLVVLAVCVSSAVGFPISAYDGSCVAQESCTRTTDDCKPHGTQVVVGTGLTCVCRPGAVLSHSWAPGYPATCVKVSCPRLGLRPPGWIG